MISILIYVFSLFAQILIHELIQNKDLFCTCCLLSIELGAGDEAVKMFVVCQNGN